MGQSNTHTNTKDSVFANFDSLADKTSFFNNGSSVYAASAVVEDRGCFSYRCCSSKKPDIATSRWKSHMVEQLKSSTLDTWPKLLIKVLNNYKDKGAENNYQAEVLMAHKHYLSLGMRTKDDSLVSVFSKHKDDSFYGKMSGENSFQFSEENNPNHEMVQELLSNCPLLEEKVYDKRHKETWIDRSFNIKVPEATEVMNKSLEKFEAVRKIEISSKNPSHNKRASPRKKTSHTKRYIEKYKNNTFITRLPNRQEQNEADMVYHMVLKYKAVTDTIDRHVKQPQHIFYRLISRFERFYYQSYFPIVEKWRSRQISEAQFDAYCERATTDLQQFIKILAEGVSWFYRLDYFQSESEALNGDSLFNNDNLMSLITSIVFTETIYITLFDLYRLKESKVEELYQKNIKYCKKLNPQDFGTADEYCLNEKTIAYFEKKNINHLRNSRTKDLLGPISSSSYDRKPLNKTDSSSSGGGSFPKKFSSPIKMYVGSLNSRNPNILSEENEALPEIPEKFTPYEDAIEMLSTLKYRKNPIQKLKTIVKVAELLTESIENFYGEIGFHRRDKLDADQTLSIFMYLVSRSNLDNLIVNCKIIQDFSTSNILNSVSGYYAITLEACIRCICAMTFQDRVTSDHLSICLKGFVNSVSRASVDTTSITNY